MKAILMTDETTEHLLDRARTGDREAFDVLCRQHSEHLTTLVHRWLGAELGAKLEPEDILQETFLRAFESIGVFRGQDERSFLSWLASIAEHLIWNASQKRSLKQAQLVFDASGSGPSPSRGLRREERLQRLEACLTGLKRDQREAIILSKIDGLKAKDIAERMGRSVDAVKQLLSRGLRQLRQDFGDTASLRLPDRALDLRAADDGTE